MMKKVYVLLPLWVIASNFSLVAAPIHKAVREANLEKVKSIVVGNKDALESTFDNLYYTPLMVAAQYNGVSIAEFLIDSGARVNRIAGSVIAKGTPLIVAVKYKNQQMAQLLIRHKANVNLGVYNGRKTPLFFAAKNRDLPMAKLLVEHGADVNKGGKRFTPLVIARKNKDAPMIQLLESKGAVR